jgi:hypothetical protein
MSRGIKRAHALLQARERIRLTAAIERALVEDVARWLARVGKLAASHLRAGHEHAAEHAGFELAPRLRATMRARLLNAAESAARLVLRDLDKAGAPKLERKGFIDDVIAAATDWVASYAASRVVQIAETTRKTLRRITLGAIDTDVGYRVTARQIVDATGGEIGKRRALRIARTEVHGAVERGNIEAIRATGYAYDKKWVAVEDKRTRPDHAEADGQQVPADGKFRVGGVLMDFPGDQTAPPRAVINCRCTVANVPRIPGR